MTDSIKNATRLTNDLTPELDLIPSRGPRAYWANFVTEHVDMSAFPFVGGIHLAVSDYRNPFQRNQLGGRSWLSITLIMKDTSGTHDGPQVTTKPLPEFPRWESEDEIQRIIRRVLFEAIGEVVLHELDETLLFDGKGGDPHRLDGVQGVVARYVSFWDEGEDEAE